MSLESKKIIPGNAKSSIYSVIKRNTLSYKDEKKLAKYINQKKAIFISTPFCREAVDRLVEFKILYSKSGLVNVIIIL